MNSIFKDENQDQILSEINVTPLVDVMLLLMIIFLVTAPLLVNNIDVNLAKTKGQTTKEITKKVITIKESGEINLDNTKMTLRELETYLKNHNKNLKIKIAADKNSRYQDVASILSLLSANRISNVSFLTRN